MLVESTEGSCCVVVTMLVFDRTPSACGGGLPEDSTIPNDEESVCVAVVRFAFAAIGTGYEFDILTRDTASDCCVLMFMVVVELAVLVTMEPVDASEVCY